MAESGSGARDGLALSPALEPFKELLRQSPLAISIVNLDGRVLMWSAESERLFGWKEAEVIGRASPHVPTDGIAKNMEHILEAAAGRPIRGVEAVRTRRDGTRVNVLLHTAAIRDANGDVAGVMGMSVDVTERRQVEIRLRNAQKMEAVGLLAGGVAHDFNNLLTAIKGFSSLLMEAVGENDAARECVDEIVRASERAAGLTGQLLAFSRRQLLRPEILDLSVRIKAMHPMLRVLAASSIDVQLDLGSDLGLVLADPVQFEQVVLNLVMNARDAIVERGKIIIRTSAANLDTEFVKWGVAPRPGAYVRLDVIDTGKGMDPLTLTRAFDPFYTTKEAGTGLGLATVFGIVKQSGGYVWPTDTSDKGTTFSVYLPRSEAMEAAVAADEAERVESPMPRIPAAPPDDTEVTREAAPSRVLRLVPRGPAREGRPGTRALDAPRATAPARLTVMVVDDDEAVRDMMRRTLARRRYTVLDAASGEEALRVSRMFTDHIDLLITDIRMPGMNGLELRDAFVAERPGLRVLFMSGHADEFMRSELRDRHTPFLGKPFSMDELEQAMQRAIAPPPSA